MQVVKKICPLEGSRFAPYAGKPLIVDVVARSSTCILSFSAEGISGTNGYVKITLEKDPEFDPEDVIVFLDAKSIEYSIESTFYTGGVFSYGAIAGFSGCLFLVSLFLHFLCHHGCRNVRNDRFRSSLRPSRTLAK